MNIWKHSDRQDGLHTIIRSIGSLAIVVSVALSATVIPVYSQQGKSRVIGGQFRIANGDSSPGTLVFRDGDFRAVFLSRATNLATGYSNVPVSIYVHDCRKGKTLRNSPRGFIPIKVVATLNRTSSNSDPKYLYMASYGTDFGNQTQIAYYNGTVWKVIPLAGEFRDLQIDIDGRFYVLTSTELREYTMTGQSRTIVSSSNFSMQRLSVSEDGRILVLSYLDLDGDEPVLYRLILSRKSDNSFVSNSRVADTYSVVDISGKILIEDRSIYQINTDPSNIYLVPMYQDVIPSGAVPIDISQDLLVYTVDAGQTARVLSFAERVDIPLQWWDGTQNHRRCIQNGFVLFAARDTQQQGVVRGDTNLLQDIFLYEVTLRRTRGITTGPMPRNGTTPSLSVGDTPSLIAFTCDSDDLVSGKTTTHTDVFIQNGGQFVRVMMPGQEPNGSSFDVSVERTPSSNRVVFASNATNLTSSPDTNNASDVYLWQPNSVSCVTCQYNGDSFRPSIAPTGIFFLSTATNIMPIPNGSIELPQAYWQSGSVRQIYRPSSSGWFVRVEDIVVSPNGQWIAITASTDSTGGNLGVFVYQFPNFNTPAAVFFVQDKDIYATSISNNTLIAFHTDASLLPQDTNQATDVYVWNPQSGQLKLISRNNGGILGWSDSFGGSIDADGKRVAFNSTARNLAALDTNNIDDVFVFDLQSETLYCATLNDDRLPVGGSLVRITGRGNHVVFATGSAELAELPYTNGVYVATHEIGCTLPGDVNGDGTVDDADLLEVMFHFGERKKMNFPDVNLDGIVDDADMLIILFNYGASCRFSVAGDGGDSDNPDQLWELRRTAEGYAILHFHKTPRPNRFDSEEVQSEDIHSAVKGRDWPYPVVGGMTNLWKDLLGDPSNWTSDERLIMKRYLTPERVGSGGDFVPAAGIPGYYYWEYPLINFQPNSNTYVRLTPKFSFTAGCAQGIEANAEIVLDLKLLGVGSDELAKARAFAGITPNYIGAGIEAYLSGNKVWNWGVYQQSPTFQHNDTSRIDKTLFKGGINFVVFGIPMAFTYDVTGWLQRTVSFQLTSVPVNAQFQFIPEAGIDAGLGLGLGFTLFGTRFSAGLEVEFDPLVSLSLPFTASAGLQQQNNQCVFSVGSSVDIVFRALQGRLNATVNTSCMGLLGLMCKKCTPNQPTKSLGFIPARCCGEKCYILWVFPYGRKTKIEFSQTIISWNGFLTSGNIWQWSDSIPIK